MKKMNCGRVSSLTSKEMLSGAYHSMQGIYFCFAWDRVKQHQDSHVCYNTFFKCINGM